MQREKDDEMRLSDGDLDIVAVKRVLDGDREAYRGLVERYGGALVRYCAGRLGSVEEGEDAAQEILVRAFRALGGFRIGASFPAWLFSIAANFVKSRAARASRKDDRAPRAQAESVDGLESRLPGPAESVMDEMEAERVAAAVAALPPDARSIVELRYYADLSVVNAAEALGISEEAAKTRLFRARRLLRKSLDSEQPFVDAGSIQE
jgi:RNA polymerase sigma-70 factor, ECF subfamily